MWSKRLKRKLSIYSKVCSNHFVTGRPTKTNPLPELYLNVSHIVKIIRNCNLSTPAKIYRLKYNKKSLIQGYKELKDKRLRTSYKLGEAHKKINPLRVSQKMKIIHDHSYISHSDPIIARSDSNSETDSCPDYDEICNADSYTNERMNEEHSYCAKSENVENPSLSPKTGMLFAAKQIEILKDERDHCLQENQELKLELCRPPNTRFRFECFNNDDEYLFTYTGLPSCKVFLWLYDCLKGKMDELTYFKGKASFEKSSTAVKGNKRGPPRVLDLKSELLVTLMKLKMDLSERDLGYRFEVSISHVSSILSTFIPFLGFEMSHLIVWPKVSALSAYYPTCFAEFGKVISIIDLRRCLRKNRRLHLKILRCSLRIKVKLLFSF